MKRIKWLFTKDRRGASPIADAIILVAWAGAGILAGQVLFWIVELIYEATK